MKRLAIFCIYSADGIVTEDIFYLISEIKKIFAEIVTVINGKINEGAFHRLSNLCAEVWFRENVGFDAGAYKFAINKIGAKRIREYDELLLCNDSFFGPFINIEDIYRHMSKRECDYWGIASQHDFFKSFVESYFLVFGRKLLTTNVLLEFFDDCIDESWTDFHEDLLHFEQGLGLYMKRRGFVLGAYVEKKIPISPTRFPYEAMLLEGQPILKKKSFNREYCTIEEVFNSIKYIREKTDYPIELVLDWAIQKRIGDFNRLPEEYLDTNFAEKNITVTTVTMDDIIAFMDQPHPVYFYGAGSWAKRILAHMDKKPAGFIESLKQRDTIDGIPVYELAEIPLDAAIVVTMDKKNTEQVVGRLTGYHNVLQLWQ